MMFAFNNMMNAQKKETPVVEDTSNDTDDDMQVNDLFEGGHKLTALENIGSSLTTLWSSCAINGIPSRENLESQARDVKMKPNIVPNVISGNQNGQGAVTKIAD
ncbi:hypothetical protein KR044_007934 [Drosophila immigrans]|nr:hypothetical protein KR044_007934 [Drosophila immigrans]